MTGAGVRSASEDLGAAARQNRNPGGHPVRGAFRGLIFGGLRRTLGMTVSVLASAAIFALVHPPAAVIPMFGLGIAAALVCERTRLLIGPIAVHAVYNAAVVGLQFLPGW